MDYIVNNELRVRLCDLVQNAIDDSSHVRQLAKDAEIPASNLPDKTSPMDLWPIVLQYAEQHGKWLILVKRIEAKINGRTDVHDLEDALDEVRESLNIAAIRAAARKSSEELAKNIHLLGESVDTLLGQDSPLAAYSGVARDLRTTIGSIYRKFDDPATGSETPGLSGEPMIGNEAIVERCLATIAAIDALAAAESISTSVATLSADERDRVRLLQSRMAAIIDAKFGVVRALRSLRNELRSSVPIPDAGL